MKAINNKELVLSVIEAIIYTGETNNFGIFNLGEDYYIQIVGNRGDYELYCEAVSNVYLEETALLSPEQESQLFALGWTVAPEQNYSLRHNVDSEDSRGQLADLILQTAELVYNCTEIEESNIILELEN